MLPFSVAPCRPIPVAGASWPDAQPASAMASRPRMATAALLRRRGTQRLFRTGPTLRVYGASVWKIRAVRFATIATSRGAQWRGAAIVDQEGGPDARAVEQVRRTRCRA